VSIKDRGVSRSQFLWESGVRVALGVFARESAGRYRAVTAVGEITLEREGKHWLMMWPSVYGDQGWEFASVEDADADVAESLAAARLDTTFLDEDYVVGARGWEYVHLAVRLRAKLEELAPARRDFDFGVRRAGELDLTDVAACVEAHGWFIEEYQRAVDNSRTLLSGAGLYAAIGAPGESGDPDAIEQLVERIGDTYRMLLAAVEVLRDARVPSELARESLWALTSTAKPVFDMIEDCATQLYDSILEAVRVWRMGGTPNVSVQVQHSVDFSTTASPAFQRWMTEEVNPTFGIGDEAPTSIDVLRQVTAELAAGRGVSTAALGTGAHA